MGVYLEFQQVMHGVMAMMSGELVLASQVGFCIPVSHQLSSCIVF